MRLGETDLRSSQGSYVQDDICRKVLPRVHHSVRQHQPALCISVVYFYGPREEGKRDLAWTHAPVNIQTSSR